MNMQDIFPEQALAELHNFVKKRANRLLHKGYSTGQIELPHIGLSFELLPNQFYKDHGHVNALPFAQNEAHNYGLCASRIKEGILTLDVYIKRTADPLLEAYLYGHEEGHACIHFGKLTEMHKLLQESSDKVICALGKTLDKIVDKNYRESQDKIMVMGLVATLLFGGVSENEQMMKHLFMAFLKQNQQREEKTEKLCDLMGLYATIRAGYTLKEAYTHLRDYGF